MRRSAGNNTDLIFILSVTIISWIPLLFASAFSSSISRPPISKFHLQRHTRSKVSILNTKKTRTSTQIHNIFRKNKADDVDATAPAKSDTDLVTEMREEMMIPPQPDEKGDVKITSASVLPTIPPTALINVYYAEQIISAMGTIGEILEAYHAGMVFEIGNYNELLASGEIGADEEENGSVPREFTVEWYAESFPFGAFLPEIIATRDGDEKKSMSKSSSTDSVSKTGLQWENESWAFYNPSYKPDRWTKGRTLIGTIAGGSAMAQYAQWIVDYCHTNPGYTAFEVWDRPYLESGVTRRWQASNTCSTFTQGSMTKLYELGKEQKLEEKIEGVDLAKNVMDNKEIIMRSYAPLISKTNPTLVDLNDPEQAREVKEFYIELSKAAKEVDGEKLTTSGFIRLLANKLEVFYVYDTPKDEYYRVDLDPPYFALTGLYQPLSVPWQRLDLDGDGELEDPAAFASVDGYKDGEPQQASFVEELGRAAQGAADLAKRRVPPVLKKRIQGTISSELATGVAIIAVAVGLGAGSLVPTEFVAIDVSFFLGVAVGVIGAKLFL